MQLEAYGEVTYNKNEGGQKGRYQEWLEWSPQIEFFNAKAEASPCITFKKRLHLKLDLDLTN
jgi:hypothetical protein